MANSAADKVHKEIEMTDMAAKCIKIVQDSSGADQVLLKYRRGYSILVSLHGGQVRSWKTESGEELLFMSSKVTPEGVRGGITTCFPQFGNRGKQHGFVRNRMWVIDNNPPPLHSKDRSDETYIDLLLKSSADDLQVWPNGFECRLRVALALDGSLELTSRITNTSPERFSFSFAHEAYFSVFDISNVRVEGLESLHYHDNKLCNREPSTEQGAVTFESKVDRVYFSSDEDHPIEVIVHNPMKRRTFLMKKKGLVDVVVWNPWTDLSEGIELAAEEYKSMVCVGGAAVEKEITLNSGEGWIGNLELSFKRKS